MFSTTVIKQLDRERRFEAKKEKKWSEGKENNLDFIGK